MSGQTIPEHGVRRVAIFAPSAYSLLTLRAPLISSILERRHKVLCFAPDITPVDEEALSELGADFSQLDFEPEGFAVFPERKALRDTADVLADWGTHAVLSLGTRSLWFGTLAAKRADVQRIVSVLNQLPQNDPHAPADEDMSPSRLERTFKAADIVVCHNHDDAAYLAANGYVPQSSEVTVVPGAGVDLDHYANSQLPPLGNGLVFAMLGTLDTTRGVLTYCDAAQRLKQRAPQARFVLAGRAGRGEGVISPAMLSRYKDCVEFIGEVNDPLDLLAKTHVFVYPSRVEGMPRSVLEALACARPVVTSDTPGCRETVDVRVNGVLIEPGNVDDLVEAMESFLRRPDLIPAMARASRLKAERRFDERAVSATLSDLLLAV